MQSPTPLPAQMSWLRFAAMIAVSTGLMFLFMYQLVYSPAHLLFSLSRLIASLLMGCVMTAVMLAFMWKMYQPTRAKIAVLAAASVGALALLVVNRNQSLVDDVLFMEAMIPHHSIAINNARKADIRDPRVRYLADRITRDQVKEIAEMKLLIDDIHEHGRRADRPLPAGSDKLGVDGAREAKKLVSGALLRDEPL